MAARVTKKELEEKVRQLEKEIERSRQDAATLKEAEQTLRRQNLYLAALQDIAPGLIQRLDLDTLLEDIVQKAGDLVDTPDGYIYLYDPTSDVLEVRVGIGRWADDIGFRLRPGEGMAGKAWQSGEMLVIDDYCQWSGRIPDPQFDNLHTLVGLPLTVGTEIIGVLGLSYFEKFRNISEDELEALKRFAQLASIAISNAQLYSNLEQELNDRKTAQEALRESERRLIAIFEAAPDPLVVYDRQGHPMFLNPAFTKVFGWYPEELQGRKIPFVPEDQKALTAEKIQRIIKTGEPQQFETRRSTKEGLTLDVNISAAIIKGQQDEFIGMVVSLTDLTATKSLERQLLQAQKMEAIGTLAGGIAHDFNNLLMGIQGRASLLLMDLEENTPVYEQLKGIEDLVRSASTLTAQMLGFARGGKYEVQTTDLNQLISEINQMFGRTHKEIRVQEALAEDLWSVDADRAQLEQVLLNLYINSWQAMPDGGDLVVQTSNQVLTEKEAQLAGASAGRSVKITVSDTGVGMDVAVRQRIFEPFFTTKERGRGTGLGLASVYGIIRNHGGFIKVDSRKNQGTTFTIYLPATDNKPARAKTAAAAPLSTDGTILLVDDEKYVLDIGRQMLQRLGFEVICADGGQKAIALFREHQDSIDLVVLDMIMPDMGGGDTFTRLKEIDPAVKVLLSSGYTIDGRASEIIQQGCDGFIQKPFSLQSLAEKVSAIIGTTEA